MGRRLLKSLDERAGWDEAKHGAEEVLGVHDDCAAGLSTTLNTREKLTENDPFPMIAVLPAISNGASYRLYGKIYGYAA